MKRWKNWAGNQRATPKSVHFPSSENELVAIVRFAQAAKRRVKLVGSGHSFTAIAVADDILVDLRNYCEFLEVSTDRTCVTVQSGIVLANLNERLHREGLAMPNLGDVTYQTIAGALSTSTHGTGQGRTGLAAQVVGFRLIDSGGNVLQCSEHENDEVFHVGRVGLGALGVLSTLTVRVVPAFQLSAVEQPMRVRDVLANIDQLVNDNDFFEFYWIPHTGWALTKRNNICDLPSDPPRRFAHWWNKIFMENLAFGALCYLGRMRPGLIPRLAKVLPSSGRVEYVNASFKIFASKRLVRFYEMEYSINRESVVPALERVMKLVDDEGLLLNFPVEVRFTAPDDVSLSTSYGRPSAYIAVHVFKGMQYEPYFRAVEKIMMDHGGRPHWGKIHFQSAESLSSLYPEYQRFIEVRNRLDPEGVFTNDYLRRVLGR
jgi:L-gulono-1,4-lactone dehydrogenase